MVGEGKGKLNAKPSKSRKGKIIEGDAPKGKKRGEKKVLGIEKGSYPYKKKVWGRLLKISRGGGQTWGVSRLKKKKKKGKID